MMNGQTYRWPCNPGPIAWHEACYFGPAQARHGLLFCRAEPTNRLVPRPLLKHTGGTENSTLFVFPGSGAGQYMLNC